MRLIFRGMLSTAHALAMDAKHLLDAVDSVRIRFPQVDLMMRENRQKNDLASGANTSREENLSSPSNSEASSHSGYGLPNKMTAI